MTRSSDFAAVNQQRHGPWQPMQPRCNLHMCSHANPATAPRHGTSRFVGFDYVIRVSFFHTRERKRGTFGNRSTPGGDVSRQVSFDFLLISSTPATFFTHHGMPSSPGRGREGRCQAHKNIGCVFSEESKPQTEGRRDADHLIKTSPVIRSCEALPARLYPCAPYR